MTLMTRGPVYEIATPELIPLGVDFTDRLGDTETVASVVACTLVNASSGVPVADALSGSPSLTGAVVTQVIDGSKLHRSTRYEYVVTVAVGTRHESTLTILTVPF